MIAAARRIIGHPLAAERGQRWLRAWAGALVAAALVASCGGGESSSAEADSKAVERAIAAFEATLREDGFETDQDDDDDDDDDFEAASEECKEFLTLFDEQDELPGSTAELDSAELERGDDEGGEKETAQASVALVRDEKDLDTAFALLHDERLQRCFQEAFEQGFEQALSEEGGDLTVADLSATVPTSSGVGDDSVAVAITGTLVVPGTKIPFGFRFDFAREGRAAAFIQLGAIGASASEVDAGPLLRVMLGEAEQ